MAQGAVAAHDTLPHATASGLKAEGARGFAMATTWSPKQCSCSSVQAYVGKGAAEAVCHHGQQLEGASSIMGRHDTHHHMTQQLQLLL